VTTTDVPRRELRLDPLLHGRGRVPGQRRRMFDLVTYAAARRRHDVAYQLACYAVDAEIRVDGPDSPPPAGRTIRGGRAITAWLEGSDALDVEVTDLVDGGDRVAFTESWQRRDGTAVVATSTLELGDGRITAQHTVLAWTRQAVDPVGGWTRVSNDLWTTAD
jgi:hypothetical protein